MHATLPSPRPCSERRAAHYTKVYRKFLKPPAKSITHKDLVPALCEVHFGTVDQQQVEEVLQVRDSRHCTALFAVAKFKFGYIISPSTLKALPGLLSQVPRLMGSWP